MKRSKPKTKAPRLPKYRIHKASRRAYVELGGVRTYLGPADDPATMQAYHAKVAEWFALGGRTPAPPEEIAVIELSAEFLRHAEVYYRHADGTATNELATVQRVLKEWVAMYGPTAASTFGPLALRAMRETWIQRGLSRRTCNAYTGMIKRIAKWAVGREILPASCWHGLQCVEGLKRGRSEARETDPVSPVSLEHIEAAKAFVSRQVAAMIDLQLLTGARSGEVVGLTPGSIDMTGEVWQARLSRHKTAHHGKDRVLFFGPRAQEVLRPFLLRPADKPLFSPIEGEAERRQRCRTHRHQPVEPPKTGRTLGGSYSVTSYGRAIARACEQAGIPSWHPHQLRHNAACEARRLYGLDGAQVLLGHSGAAITELYAEIDGEKARRIMAEIG